MHHAQFQYSQITDHIYLGTNLCCTDKTHSQVLAELEITAEIDLEGERQEPIPDVEVYLWLPIPDKTAPSMEQMGAGISLIRSMVEMNKKVYVHCQFGHGRSPLLVAGYFVTTGMNPDQAIGLVKNKRPEIHLNKVQQEMLDEYSLFVRS